MDFKSKFLNTSKKKKIFYFYHITLWIKQKIVEYALNLPKSEGKKIIYVCPKKSLFGIKYKELKELFKDI